MQLQEYATKEYVGAAPKRNYDQLVGYRLAFVVAYLQNKIISDHIEKAAENGVDPIATEGMNLYIDNEKVYELAANRMGLGYAQINDELTKLFTGEYGGFPSLDSKKSENGTHKLRLTDYGRRVILRDFVVTSQEPEEFVFSNEKQYYEAYNEYHRGWVAANTR